MNADRIRVLLEMLASECMTTLAALHVADATGLAKQRQRLAESAGVAMAFLDTEIRNRAGSEPVQEVNDALPW